MFSVLLSIYQSLEVITIAYSPMIRQNYTYTVQKIRLLYELPYQAWLHHTYMISTTHPWSLIGWMLYELMHKHNDKLTILSI
jgi:hypothetical protein